MLGDILLFVVATAIFGGMVLGTAVGWTFLAVVGFNQLRESVSLWWSERQQTQTKRVPVSMGEGA